MYQTKAVDTKMFKSISLEEIEQVRLMDRTDTKYYFNESRLQELFKAIQGDYFVLEINNETILPYSTVYYDTPENKMFTAHHNGKLNRYKIRRRSYEVSKMSFLEVKFKSNKGRTIKYRVPAQFDTHDFNRTEHDFLSRQSPFSTADLQPSLNNNFRRITLANKHFNERCTFDFNLSFESKGKQIKLEHLVIVEVKAESLASASPLSLALREMRIKTGGFSKYCIGRAVTDSSLKHNAFKQKIREIEKLRPPLKIRQ